MSHKIEKTKVSVEAKPGSVTVTYTIPNNYHAIILLAHGAGAGMDHPFIMSLSQHLADTGLAIVTFNFPYMENGKKFPGSAKTNIQAIGNVLKAAEKRLTGKPIFLGGKSYGGRMSSHLAAESNLTTVKGLIFYGFPLHAPGKPGTERAAHLKNVTYPMLFVQGGKDKLADKLLLNEVVSDLDDTKLIFYENADHSFKRPKRISKESLIPKLAKDTSEWIGKNI